jgi:hypothetical protein
MAAFEVTAVLSAGLPAAPIAVMTIRPEAIGVSRIVRIGPPEARHVVRIDGRIVIIIIRLVISAFDNPLTLDDGGCPFDHRVTLFISSEVSS